MTALFPLLPWIVQATIKGSIAIIVMTAAYALIGRRLRARWWCALWLLALVRLAAPTAPGTEWSLFNFVPLHPGIELQLRGPAAQLAVPWWIVAWKWLVLVWFAGFAILVCRMIIATVRVRSIVRRALASGKARDIVEEARVQLHIRREIAVVESPLIDGPALHGVFRPTLLLPEGMCSAFDREELRHIILHELAHLRRHDIAVNWIVNAIRAMHWFNPLVWLAATRIQEERELACDELTLACLDPQERTDYGRTILKVIACFRSAEPVPALVGIVNRKQQMRRRLMMIQADGRRSPFAVPVLAVLSAIGCMALVDAPRIDRATLDPGAVRTLECLERRIDVDVTNASLTDLLGTISAQSGVKIAGSSSVPDLRCARFSLHAVKTPASAVLTAALSPYGIVAVPSANGMTLTTGPPCLERRSATHH
jgi:bla regulator protein BlaR1